MASSIILLPFYTHYLSTDTLGALWIYLAFSILIQIIVTFSFDSSIYVHFHEYRKDRQKLARFTSSVFLLILLVGLGVILVMGIVGNFLFNIIYKDQSISFFPYGLICLFTGLFQALFKVYSSYLQTCQKPELYFKSNLLSFSLIACFTIAGLQIYPGSLIGPLGGRLFAGVISGSWSFSRIIKEFGFHFDYKLLRASFSFNFYTFIYQLQQWTVNYFDRILMSFFLPLSVVGVYGFAVSCLLVIEFIVNGLNTSFSPKVIGIVIDQPVKGSTPEVNRYYYGLTAAAMILVASCILAFPIVAELFNAKPTFKLSIQYMPFIALIYLFKPMRMYFAIPYGVLKYSKPLPVIYTIVVGVKIGSLILLIEYFGIYGVIISTMLSYWLEIILLYQNGKNRFRFKYNPFKLLAAPIVLALVIATLESFFGITWPIYLHIFYMGACLILLILAFRNEVKLIDPFKILHS